MNTIDIIKIEIPKKKTYTEAQKKAIYNYRQKKKDEGINHYNKEKHKEYCNKWRSDNKDKFNVICSNYYNEKIKPNDELRLKRNEKARVNRKKKLECTNS